MKKQLAGTISSSEIDAVHKKIRRMGSYGGKLSGAGDAGFSFFETMHSRLQRHFVALYGASRVLKVDYEPLGSRLLSVLMLSFILVLDRFSYVGYWVQTHA
jgi:galactokinase/mevalonate kinase-like predicted kinase